MADNEPLVPPPPQIQPYVRMVIDPKKLPRQLKAIRQEQDVTLASLSSNMPVSTRTMSRLEKGTSDVHLLHLAEWVRLLGYDIALVYRDGNSL